MHSGRKYSTFQTIKWTKLPILVFATWSTVITVAHETFQLYNLQIPWLPISLIGVVLAFYLAFKNNSAYDRLWEARKIWGGIVNYSRTWAIFVINTPSYPPHERDKKIKEFIYTHFAWVTALRYALRQPRPWEHQDRDSKTKRTMFFVPELRVSEEDVLNNYLDAEQLAVTMGKTNKCTHLLAVQSENLKKLKESGAIDSFEYVKMTSLLEELFNLQGNCERIKNFPLPRQYASTSMMFVKFFIVLLPLGMIGEFTQIGHGWAWLAIPFGTLISWLFYTMELIGDHSENPFEGLANDVPISTLAVTIEADLKAMIDDDTPTAECPVHKKIVF